MRDLSISVEACEELLRATKSFNTSEIVELSRLRDSVFSNSFVAEQLKAFDAVRSGYFRHLSDFVEENSKALNIMNESLAAIIESTKRSIEFQSMDKYLKDTAEAISIDSAFTTWALKALEKQFAPHKESLIGFTEELSELIGKVAYTASPLFEIPKQIKSLDLSQIHLSDLNEVLKAYKNIDFEFDDDGNLLLEGNKYYAEEINKEIGKVIERNQIDIDKNDWVASFNIVLNKLKSIKEKLQNSILFVFFLGVLSSLVASIIYAHYSLPIVSRTKKIAEKKIKKEIRKNRFPNSRKIRYVNAQVLNVRVKPGKKYEKIGSLQFGNAVYVIKKGRDWSLIHYTYDDIVVQGWVFSRYLKPLDARAYGIGTR